jgi:hypothetical protein
VIGGHQHQQLGSILVGQFVDQDRPKRGEDRDVGADAKGQNDDRRDRERWPTTEYTERH